MSVTESRSLPGALLQTEASTLRSSYNGSCSYSYFKFGSAELFAKYQRMVDKSGFAQQVAYHKLPATFPGTVIVITIPKSVAMAREPKAPSHDMEVFLEHSQKNIRSISDLIQFWTAPPEVVEAQNLTRLVTKVMEKLPQKLAQMEKKRKTQE